MVLALSLYILPRSDPPLKSLLAQNAISNLERDNEDIPQVNTQDN